MNKTGTKISILTAMLFALIIAVAAPATASAQGKSHGRGRGNGDRGSNHDNWGSNHDKKCGKFVNCHDARDGRRDGRGPNRAGFWHNGVFVPRGTRVQNRTNNGRSLWTLAQRRARARRDR